MIIVLLLIVILSCVINPVPPFLLQWLAVAPSYRPQFTVSQFVASLV